LDQQRVQKLNQIDQQILVKEEQMFNKITGEINRAVVSWADGTQRFGASMQQLWKGIADTAIANILKMTEQIILAEIEHKAIAQVGILTDAKSAAAAAFKWATESVPFPANVIVAPAAAATAFAGVMAFASAAGGMDVKHDQLAMVHKNEMVLPESIASKFRALTQPTLPANFSNSGINAIHSQMSALHGSGQSSPAGAQGSSGGGGFGSSVTNNKTVNNHMRPTIIVNNPGTTVSQADIEKAVRKGVRSGALQFSP
jgi:hypothetical protein